MIRPYADARLGGLRGDGLVTRDVARFVFRGSERDVAPLSAAMVGGRTVPYRGPVENGCGTIQHAEREVRVLAIEKVDALTQFHFVCTMEAAERATTDGPT